MTFADLNLGDSVFVDANTFIYHFTPDPALGPACSALLQRIENQEIGGFTSVHVLAEVAHKLMTIEANRVYGWPFAGMANRLRRHPAEVQRLSLFRLCIDQIARGRIQILDAPLAALVNAAALSQRTGLLTNDALIAALMQHHGLSNLASADPDFDRVPGLSRYSPT